MLYGASFIAGSDNIDLDASVAKCSDVGFFGPLTDAKYNMFSCP